jgi:hypothetical protein
MSGLHEQRSADFARRVAVEQFLLDAARGKRPLPTADECRELAHKLGIPDEYRAPNTESALLSAYKTQWQLKQAAQRAHDICNQLRILHPDIESLGDDGELHCAIHSILSIDTPNAREVV